jgi:integrase
LEEAERLLAELSDKWRPVAALCLFAGLRIGEALSLTWADVNFAAGVIHAQGTKTEASRADVDMVPRLAAELAAHRDRLPGVGAALVFRTGTGRPENRHNAGRAIRAAGSRAGLDGEKKLGPHDLRHSCANILDNAGVPWSKISAILRHADVRVTTTVYAGLTQKQRAGLRDEMALAFGAGS